MVLPRQSRFFHQLIQHVRPGISGVLQGGLQLGRVDIQQLGKSAVLPDL
jgi:hypothetical protein